jgi:hypothetical protein
MFSSFIPGFQVGGIEIQPSIFTRKLARILCGGVWKSITIVSFFKDQTGRIFIGCDKV